MLHSCYNVECFTVYYRKTELYEMSWNLREGLKDSLLSAAPYGGPIGTNKQTQIMYTLYIYTPTQRVSVSQPY